MDGGLDLVKEDEEKVRRKYKRLYREKEQIEEQNKRYEEALEFYADEKIYREMADQSGVLTVIEDEYGEKARQALQKNRRLA